MLYAVAREGSDLLSNYNASYEARALGAIGEQTASATQELSVVLANPQLTAPLNGDREDVYRILLNALQGWDDGDAAMVIAGVSGRLREGRDPFIRAIGRWARAHPNDPQAVLDCLSLDPPPEITISQRLSRVGSQKLVFVATWRTTQTEVVVKRFIDPEAAPVLLDRELQAHVFSISHPNIIETHLLKNELGQPFLVERRLPVILSDSWRSEGVQEAANLICHIARALAFLSDEGLVHGDVKPDNIGFNDGTYVLLDFGICRPKDSFMDDTTPTGSLRTRAPEVLLGSPHTAASDVWALGATVFHALVGRYPLFGRGEKVPRPSNPEARKDAEEQLADRVQREWDEYMSAESIPEPMREIVRDVLHRDVSSRPSAHELVRRCEDTLGAFIRASAGPRRLSPAEEIEQLEKYLPSANVLAMMPYSQTKELQEHLRRLQGARGLTDSQRSAVDRLLSRLAS